MSSAGPVGQQRQINETAVAAFAAHFIASEYFRNEYVMSVLSRLAAAHEKQVLRLLYSNVHAISMARLRNCTQVAAVAGSPAITTCSSKHKRLGSTQRSSPVPARLLSLLQ